MLKQLKECDWIADRDLTDRFSLRVELPPIFQYYTALEFYDTYKNVILSSHVAESPKDAYTIRNWADDMYEGIWESAIKRRQPTAGDRIMQNLYASFLTTAVTKKGSLTKVSTGKSFAGDNTFMPSVDHIVAFGLDESGVVAKTSACCAILETENGYGYVASQVLIDFGQTRLRLAVPCQPAVDRRVENGILRRNPADHPAAQGLHSRLDRRRTDTLSVGTLPVGKSIEQGLIHHLLQPANHENQYTQIIGAICIALIPALHGGGEMHMPKIKYREATSCKSASHCRLPMLR